MSKIYPNLEDYTNEEMIRRSSSNLETNCGQIFSKGSAITRDIIEKFEETELGPQNAVICGHEFKNRQLWVISGLVLLFLSSCIGMGLMFTTSMFDTYVLSNMAISNKSLNYNLWKGPFVKAFLKVHIFNYTNVDDYERGYDTKLKIEDIGPFVYEETTEKVNIVFHDNGTVTYQEKRSHRFRPDLSKGRKQSDRIIVPNLPLLGAAAASQDSYFLTRLTMSTILSGLNSKPFLNLPAHRFIWGYDDNFYELAKGVLSLQHDVPFEKFGILTSRNGTSSDKVTVYTGQTDVNKIGQIDNFNGDISILHWSTDECNKIMGSDGTVFPPYDVRAKKPVQAYLKELCRRLPFKYDKEVKILNGKIPAYRYALPDTVFDTPETVPENQCYCDMNSGNCAPKGVFNTTPCFYGAPAFISFPHFYNADPVLLEQIDGLDPLTAEHESYIDVHPKLGFAMAGKSRLQMNVQIKKSFGITQLDMFRDNMMLPITWIETGLDVDDLPDFVKDQIYLATFTVAAIEMSLKYGCLLTSVVTLAGLLIIFRGKWYERRLQLRCASAQSRNQFVS